MEGKKEIHPTFQKESLLNGKPATWMSNQISDWLLVHLPGKFCHPFVRIYTDSRPEFFYGFTLKMS